MLKGDYGLIVVVLSIVMEKNKPLVYILDIYAKMKKKPNIYIYIIYGQ